MKLIKHIPNDMGYEIIIVVGGLAAGDSWSQILTSTCAAELSFSSASPVHARACVLVCVCEYACAYEDAPRVRCGVRVFRCVAVYLQACACECVCICVVLVYACISVCVCVSRNYIKLLQRVSESGGLDSPGAESSRWRLRRDGVLL
jgi:hypothetical protein